MVMKFKNASDSLASKLMKDLTSKPANEIFENKKTNINRKYKT
jgi:hypothetical protein